MGFNIQPKSFQPIDIREIVRAKNPKIERKIPGFIYKWLTRILHLKEINLIMKDYGHLTGVDFLREFFSKNDIRFNLVGAENIPREGKFIFAGNHPLGGLDGTIILYYLNENIGLTRTLSNDFLMEIKPLSEWFVPINKVGKQSRHSVNQIDELYQSDNQILIFPAGLCSRKIKGKITDLTWQKHFIQKAVEYKTDIIPIYFDGKNSNFFYNLAKIRKFFRIKFNIEMMYLADEMFKNRGKAFTLHFGKPISYTTFKHTKKPLEWAAEVKKITYSLAGC
jgi:putative hemolysin